MTSRSRTSPAFVAMIGLNNRGVKLFQERDLSSASKCFQASLEILQHQLVLTQQNKQQCRSDTAALAGDPGHPVVVSRRVPSKLKIKNLIAATSSRRRKSTTAAAGSNAASAGSTTSATTIRETTSLREDPSLLQGETSLTSRLHLSTHYIASKPIKLVVIRDPDQAKSSTSLITVIIAFNLALTHHLSGFTASPLRARKYWRSALALYGVAVNLRRKAQPEPSFPQPEGTRLFLDLALLNNVAALHHQFGDSQRASSFFHALSQCVQSLNTRQLGDAQGFVSNIVLLNVQGANADAVQLATAA